MESNYPTLESLGVLKGAGRVHGLLFYYFEMKFQALEIAMFPLGGF